MIKFGICPHDTGKNLKKWKSFKERLEKLLGEEVQLISAENFEEERKLIERETFDLYYASPDVAIELYRKGYVPTAKIKRQKDVFVLLGKEYKEKETYTLAIADIKSAVFGLLNIEAVDRDRIKLLYTKSHEESIEAVKKGEADLALVFEDYLKGRREVKDFEILERLPEEAFHVFMLHPRREKEIKEALLQIKKVREIKRRDFQKILLMEVRLKKLLTQWQEHDIAKAIDNLPHLGIVIYREKVEYADRTALNLLGYTLEEVKQKSVEELVPEEYRQIIGKIKELRLKGDASFSNFREIEALSKDGRRIPIMSASYPILYQGKYAGFVVFIDISKKKRLEKLYALLRDINQTITATLFEEEMFEKVCQSLVEKMGLRFVWVGKVSEDGWVVPVSKCGHEEGYLEKIRISVSEERENGRGPTGTAMREGRIVINPDTRTNPAVEPWREEMLKRGYLSSCAIPIQVEGKTLYTLNLYASEPNYFEEENREVLKEIKRDIEFALNRMREIRKSIVISRALDIAHDWVVVTDAEGTILYANRAVSEISGYDHKEIIGQNPRIFKSGIHPKEFYKELWDTILSGKVFRAVIVNRKKNGELFNLDVAITPVDLPGGVKRFVAVGKDITKELQLSREVEKLKFYDPLTGLLNLNGFSFKVSEILKKGIGRGVLMLVDLHNLTLINKAFGLRVGDEILKRTGERLRNIFREDDIVAKVGGDEFGLFIYPIKKKQDALVVAEKVREAFHEPLEVWDERIRVNINGGVAVYPDDGIDFRELYEKASLSLRIAKELGENHIVFFNKELEDKAHSFVRAKDLLERALEKRLFMYEFQPYFRTEDLSVGGAELLLRIKDEDGKIHYPGEFIEYLENSHMLREFEERALAEVRRLLGKFPVPLSMNISARSFRSDEFMEKLTRLASNFPGKLVVEITERILIENVERTTSVLGEFKKYGRVAVDDFGTGYSALSYVKDLPIDMLKIDMTFTKNMLKSKKDRAIVEVITHFADRIGLSTVAEGVETQEQLEELKKIGSTYVQGFLLAKPMPEEKFEEFLKKGGR